MAAMCSESKPWTLRSLSLPLVSYTTLVRAKLECERRAGTALPAVCVPFRGACGRARQLIVLRSHS